MKILSFGEVLWDIYPDKSVIGGAPFNFSSHAVKLGAKVDIITAVGSDELGEKTREIIRHNGVSEELVAETKYPTGACFVTVDENGIPSYELRFDMAYDHIELNSEQCKYLNGEKYDAFYFGTLALRHEHSLKTLKEVLNTYKFSNILFDVNIRQKWYNRDIIKSGLEFCTFLKVSREECQVFCELGLVDSKPENFESKDVFYKALCKELAVKYNIKLILFTLDKEGSMVYSLEDDKILISDKPRGKAVSTVGAGDSFSAGFLCSYLKGDSLEKSLLKATVLSNFVVQNIEAIPEYTPEIAEKLS